MTTTTLLQATGLHYTYPGAKEPAIRDLTLSVPAGKKSVLLGRNGCGKSTLFLAANGLCRPDAGTVFWRGKPVAYDRRSLLALRRDVGLVLQDPEQQLVAGTVAEDISYGLCNQGLPDYEVKEKVQAALERFQLTELADRPLHQLSLGQKKRVSLAGVMVLSPQLLLLDEPTAYLDPSQTRRLIEELEQIHQAGTAILMATHDLELAWSWADWVFVMENGRLVMQGEPHEVLVSAEELKALQLGVPQMVALWQALPDRWKEQMTDCDIPRSIDEWRAQLAVFDSRKNEEPGYLLER
ncbi:energy-coupling factor ABC transporter ATP-binding protein [Brevibacillus fluminis]|uniref:energy-coupling factor ABC transporter ATP-binding protein n=1 Tax=Brevibacillus fluminis TaxID=511487 RepID=UPI003F8C78F5